MWAASAPLIIWLTRSKIIPLTHTPVWQKNRRPPVYGQTHQHVPRLLEGEFPPGHRHPSQEPRRPYAGRHPSLTCFRPIDVWPAAPPAKGFVFSRSKSYVDRPATSIPCGKCMGCRITRQDEWRTRIILEGKMHECSTFLTLTYGPEHVPSDYSLSKLHAQTWLKRLRRVLEPLRVRYFLCGEYGDKNLRPHYHCIVFGYDFPDRTLWRRAASGELSYRSALLEKTWPLGHCELGSFTPQSAGYVAGYSLKKITGEPAQDHYRRMNPATGEIHQVTPEFILQSTRPGIGRSWFDTYGEDAFPSDFVIIDGVRKPVPRYFKRVMQEGDLHLSQRVDAARKSAARKSKQRNPENTHWRRLQDREEYIDVQQKQRKPKELDNDN